MILNFLALLSGTFLFFSIFFLQRIYKCNQKNKRTRRHFQRLTHLEQLISKEVTSDSVVK